MKTMKDFKGTQGEFEIVGNKIQVNPDDPLETSTIAMMFGSMAMDENIANARLFANSKKVLEAAIEAANVLRVTSQADGVSSISKAALSKLEQAINDSL